MSTNRVLPRWGIRMNPGLVRGPCMVMVTPWRRLAFTNMGEPHRIGGHTFPGTTSSGTTISAGLGRLGSLRVSNRRDGDFE